MNIDYEKLGEVAENASHEHRAILEKMEIDGRVPIEVEGRHYQKRWGFIAEAVIDASGLLEEVERLRSALNILFHERVNVMGQTVEDLVFESNPELHHKLTAALKGEQ